MFVVLLNLKFFLHAYVTTLLDYILILNYGAVPFFAIYCKPCSRLFNFRNLELILVHFNNLKTIIHRSCMENVAMTNNLSFFKSFSDLKPILHLCNNLCSSYNDPKPNYFILRDLYKLDGLGNACKLFG